ncbi:putative pectate lyase C [Mycena kentingensis (nom. inval.)]|nr:putative pectate lyase C [Mycena kentingensis (nom. inval.)]
MLRISSTYCPARYRRALAADSLPQRFGPLQNLNANRRHRREDVAPLTMDVAASADYCQIRYYTYLDAAAQCINRIRTRDATDSWIVQHNGAGTVIINSFYAENFGKVYRSCGNCGTQFKRTVQINDLWAVNGDVVAGINTNFGDTATIRTTRIQGMSLNDVCARYTGNDDGDEPVQTGSGPDSTFCRYTSADITVG